MSQNIVNKISTDLALADLNLIKAKNPLIHNITNLVVMQTTANVLLALGASPIMAHAVDEMQDLLSIVNALVINIGTLDSKLVAEIAHAQSIAQQLSLPIVFDPVGAGASQYRTQVARKILESGVNIIRGNSSEIMALASDLIKTKGVDALHESSEALTAAKFLADQYHCIVVISGQTDFIVDNNHHVSMSHGSKLFTKVTGMGCAATAVIAAFAAINKSYFNAALSATLVFTLAGEIAAKQSQGPGSFSVNFLDTLSNFDEAMLAGNST